MPETPEEHVPQKREMPEPFENYRPMPWIVIILVAGIFLWAVSYIIYNRQFLPLAPELGDHRVAADFAVVTASTTGAVDGAQIYTANCLACHQATGAGLPGVFPPLAGSEWVQGTPKGVIQIVLHGISGKLTVHGSVYNGQMPTFKDKLNDAQIAAVLSHIRSSFGNKADKIDAAVVKTEREATKSRDKPWNGDAELASLK